MIEIITKHIKIIEVALIKKNTSSKEYRKILGSINQDFFLLRNTNCAFLEISTLAGQEFDLTSEYKTQLLIIKSKLENMKGALYE